MYYYHIRTYTPFCGEEADIYIAAETENEYHTRAHQAAIENGMEWFEEPDWVEDYADRDDAIEDYYAQCGWRLIGMITEEEFVRKKNEGEWTI